MTVVLEFIQKRINEIAEEIVGLHDFVSDVAYKSGDSHYRQISDELLQVHDRLKKVV